MRVLLTGMSGVGKSTVVAELRRRGHLAFDADDDGFTEPRADGRWGWRLDDIRALLATHVHELVFFAGCSEEQALINVDLRILLTLPEETLRERLRTRTTNAYGRGPGELDQVLSDLRAVEPLLRSSADLVVDATLPVQVVTERILHAVTSNDLGLASRHGPRGDPDVQDR